MNFNLTLDEKVQEIIKKIKPLHPDEALKQVWEKEKGELLLLFQEYHPIIMVAGNIGFGKTTVAGFVGSFGKIPEIKEPVDNPLLKLYYDDMKAYSERLQTDLINVRLFDLFINKNLHPNQALIFDRTPYEDTYIFSEALCKNGLMSPDSLKFCYYYFSMKKRQLESRYKTNLNPDLIIFLKGDIETGWKRVQGRQRSIEVREDAKKGVGLTKEFYQSLHNEYETFVERLQVDYTGPILTLPQDTLAVADATNTKGQLYVIQSTKEALKLITAQKT